MKKAISISLYGDSSVYAVGAIENVLLAKSIYPNWEVVIHCEEGHYAIPRLKREGARVITHPRPNYHEGMKWRYLTGDDASYSHVIFRDADSRLNVREQAAVEEWVKSGKSLHRMHDHKHHRKHIMGGMFGVKPGIVDFKKYCDDWNRVGKNKYGDDEDMLWFIFETYPAKDTVSHNKSNFPDHPEYKGFVGEQIKPSFDKSKIRVVMLSAERYHSRRARFYQSLKDNGGFLNDLEVEWWQATHYKDCYAPPSFREARKRKHWWSATCDHLAIMEECILGGYEYVIILEDDANFVEDFNERFWKAWCCLPEGWRGLRLGWHELPGKTVVVPGILDRASTEGALMIGMMWTREGLIRAYDHFWHRRKMIIDIMFCDLRKKEPEHWYQPSTQIITKDPLAKQRGEDS